MAVTRPNFGSLLDTNADAIERPKPMPEGSYLWVVQGLPRYDKSSKKQTEFAEFTLKCVAAGDDVDAESLAAMGGIEDKTQRATFYLTEKSLYRLKEFLQHCGIEVEGRPLRESIEEAPNCQVGAYIRHEASDDGETIYANLGKTFLADAFNEQSEAA